MTMVTIAPASRAASSARHVRIERGCSLLRMVPSMSRAISLYPISGQEGACGKILSETAS